MLCQHKILAAHTYALSSDVQAAMHIMTSFTSWQACKGLVKAACRRGTAPQRAVKLTKADSACPFLDA